MTQDLEPLKTEALTWQEKAAALTVTNQGEYETGALWLQQIRDLRNKLNAAFDPIISSAHKTHKAALGQKKEAEYPLEKAEKQINRALCAYEPEEKVEGLIRRQTWHAEVLDPMLLVKHVAKHPELVNLLEPKMAALNSLARAQQDGLDIPGVRAVSKTGIALTS